MKCSLLKSDTWKGASLNFLLVFAKALWIPLTAKKSPVALRCLEPSSQQIDYVQPCVVPSLVLGGDHLSTETALLGMQKENLLVLFQILMAGVYLCGNAYSSSIPKLFIQGQRSSFWLVLQSLLCANPFS